MYKNLMLEFLKGKDQILFEETNIHLYGEEDYKDIEIWGEDFCKEFFRLLTISSKGIHSLDDTDICPWCIFHVQFNSPCYRKCNYGERHGSCYKGCMYPKFEDNPIIK